MVAKVDHSFFSVLVDRTLFLVELCKFLDLSGLAVLSRTNGFVQCELVDLGPVRPRELIGYSVVLGK